MPDPTYPNNSRADLYRCNLDPSGRYTAYWGSSVRRDNYFSFTGARVSPVAPYCLPLDDSDKFCYVKKDGILKVDVNADTLDSLGINYCRFANPNFTGDYVFYIYAFVDRIEYLAPHTSALHIRVDTFTTYQDYIERNEQYIARRTVSYTEDAAIKYGYSVPEQISGTNYKSVKVASKVFGTGTGEFFTAFWLCVLVKPFPLNDGRWIEYADTSDPDHGLDPNWNVKLDLNGWCYHFMNGFPSGCNIFMVNSATMLKELSEVVNALGSEIIGTFWVHNTEGDGVSFKHKTYPHIYYQDVTHKVDVGDVTVYTIDTMTVKELAINFVDSDNHYGKTDELDRYTPINAKCYTYPYNYLIASDNNGTIIEYRYEDFASGTPDFDCKFIASTDNAIVLIPKNYMGNNDTLDYSLFITGFPQCPYMSDNYAMYLGTHAAQTAVARYSRIMDYGKSFVNLGIATYRAKQAVDRMPYTTQYERDRANRSFDDFATAYEDTLHSVDNTIKAVAKESDQPAVNVYNAGATSNLATLGYLGFVMYHKFLCKHDMERVDEYFSRYGYAWMKLENLNFTKCPDYNYIQTIGCNIEGAIPVSAKAELSRLFDSGITMWDCSTDGKIERFGLYADSSHPNKGNL